MEINNVVNQGAERMSDYGPYVARKRIRSTIYEISVYFSQTSCETLNDKILRLARNEILDNEDGHN
jgi:hypothetical protein